MGKHYGDAYSTVNAVDLTSSYHNDSKHEAWVVETGAGWRPKGDSEVGVTARGWGPTVTE